MKSMCSGALLVLLACGLFSCKKDSTATKIKRLVTEVYGSYKASFVYGYNGQGTLESVMEADSNQLVYYTWFSTDSSIDFSLLQNYSYTGHYSSLLTGGRPRQETVHINYGGGNDFVRNFSYDGSGRLVQVKNGETDSITIKYDAGGDVTGLRYVQGKTVWVDMTVHQHDDHPTPYSTAKDLVFRQELFERSADFRFPTALSKHNLTDVTMTLFNADHQAYETKRYISVITYGDDGYPVSSIISAISDDNRPELYQQNVFTYQVWP